MAILTVVGALALSVFGKLLADEAKAWRPKICDAMIKCAASQLLPFQRERYIEQWRCDLEEIPGEFFKLYFALDLIRGTWLARVSPGATQAHSIRNRSDSEFEAAAYPCETSIRVVTRVFPTLAHEALCFQTLVTNDFASHLE